MQLYKLNINNETVKPEIAKPKVIQKKSEIINEPTTNPKVQIKVANTLPNQESKILEETERQLESQSFNILSGAD